MKTNRRISVLVFLLLPAFLAGNPGVRRREVAEELVGPTPLTTAAEATPLPTLEPTSEPSPAPTNQPTPAPTLEPTPSPTPNAGFYAALEMMDSDLLQVANAAMGLGLDPSLQAKVDSFEQSKSDTTREELKQATMEAISQATRDQFWDLIEPESDHFSTALHAWNEFGEMDTGDGTQRSLQCTLISSPESMVDNNIRSCMCGDADPFVRCQLMLGSSALARVSQISQAATEIRRS